MNALTQNTKIKVSDINTLISECNNSVRKTGNESIAGLKTFTDGMKAIEVSNQTVDSATLFSTNTGSIQHYWSSTDGGTANITNLPSKMAFMLISYTYRYISASDYWVEQQLFQAGKTYRRTIRSGTVNGWTSIWVA